MSTLTANEVSIDDLTAQLEAEFNANPDADPKAATSSGGGIAIRDKVTMSVTNDGYCSLDAISNVCGKVDFVAIYQNANLPANQYESSSKIDVSSQSKFPYKTKVKAIQGLVAIYWSWDYISGQWTRVCFTPELPNGQAGTTVYQSSF